MIVDPDFLTHWKTQALVEALDDHAAPVYVIALWSHCQLRRVDRFEGVDHSTFAKICRYPFKGDSVVFFEAMKECGFVEVEGDTVIARGWAETNSRLYSSWENGRFGGRPANPHKTQQKPKIDKVELGTLEKRREDRRRKEKSTPPTPSEASPSARSKLSGIFGRREKTAWSEKEEKSFRKLAQIEDYDLDLLERYYAANRKKPDNICRRDLFTLLNNFQGELDRARDWCEKHPVKTKVVRFAQPKPKEEEDWTPDQVADNKRRFQEMVSQVQGVRQVEEPAT